MNTNFQMAKESKQPQNLETGTNFKRVDLGEFRGFGEYIEENRELNLKSKGKVFLHDLLELTSAEISINYAPVGYKVPFKHKHNQNEEIYIGLKGKGLIEVDDKKIEIKEGTFVKVKPEGIRTIENTANEDMIFMVIQTKANSLEQFTLTDATIV